MSTREDRHWPTWGPYEGIKRPDGFLHPYAALASYVSVEAVERAPRLKVPRPAEYRVEAGADRDLAASLYERLAGLRLDYALDPKVPRGIGQQQIRDPKWLIDAGWGTCLDLAVTYAAMCSAVGMQPLLVVGDGHALVALVLGGSRDPEAPIQLRGCDDEESGVLRIRDPDGLAGPHGEAVLAVECTSAVTRVGTSGGASVAPSAFDAAVAAGTDALRRPGMCVVDVAWLQTGDGGIKPLAPPDSDLTIRLHLRGGLAQEDLGGSQTAVLRGLEGKTGVHVIVADPGFGKSTIARRLVLESPFGAGWFLGASDSRVLTNSLAEAELAQRNETGVGLSDIDRAGYAESAIGRLREARHAWLVVLDNADEDPGRMLRRLPTPSEQHGQLIVVTTTNSDWAATCGYPLHNLEQLTPGEVLSELENSALVPFVGGRWLLVTAFKRLAASLDTTTAELEIDSSIAPSRENGPRAFWSTVRGRALAGDDETLRAARCAAFLPPDNVSMDAVDAICSGAAERLRKVGLIEHAGGEDFGRMHRLFRAAIQEELERSPEAAGEIAVLLARTPEACNNLAEFGDRELVDRILELLEAQDSPDTAPDRELGRSFHAIGSVLELRNHTKRSADSFDRARRHLDQAVRDDRLLLAECLLGMARPQFQHGKTEAEWRQGLAWADEAQQLMIDSAAAALAGRFLAMRGLLKRKLAERDGISVEQAIRELREALEMIEEADRLRQADGSARPEELSRSAYNRAGPLIGLAQRERSHAVEHLDKAEATYKLVLGQRRAFYPHLDAHGHIAACIAGVATVDYLRATLLEFDRDERVGLLRGATVNALEAMRQRELLSGPDDNDDVGKSHRLLAKIAMARHLAPVPADKARVAHDKLLGEVADELEAGGFLA